MIKKMKTKFVYFLLSVLEVVSTSKKETGKTCCSVSVVNSLLSFGDKLDINYDPDNWATVFPFFLIVEISNRGSGYFSLNGLQQKNNCDPRLRKSQLMRKKYWRRNPSVYSLWLYRRMWFHAPVPHDCNLVGWTGVIIASFLLKETEAIIDSLSAHRLLIMREKYVLLAVEIITKFVYIL